ncbi:MAG: CPXCG motif-containing cysteine-rich protein [Motiliproteus sp.]
MTISSRIERRVICPWCSAGFTLLIDPSLEEQDYLEDCQVCCQPILLDVVVDCEQRRILHLDLKREND